MTTEEDVSEADEIALWVYGEEGNTGPLVLWSGEQNGTFQAGNTDDFKVRMPVAKQLSMINRYTVQ